MPNIESLILQKKVNPGFAQQIKVDNDTNTLDKLCIPCVGSKSNRVV